MLPRGFRRELRELLLGLGSPGDFYTYTGTEWILNGPLGAETTHLVTHSCWNCVNVNVVTIPGVTTGFTQTIQTRLMSSIWCPGPPEAERTDFGAVVGLCGTCVGGRCTRCGRGVNRRQPQVRRLKSLVENGVCEGCVNSELTAAAPPKFTRPCLKRIHARLNLVLGEVQ